MLDPGSGYSLNENRAGSLLRPG